MSSFTKKVWWPLALVCLAQPAAASPRPAVVVLQSRAPEIGRDAVGPTIRIHGVFKLMMPDGTWGAHACGYMYFRCPTGQTCDMHWNDIRRAYPGKCAWLGNQVDDTNRWQSQGTVRQFYQAPSEPDPFRLGVGVMVDACPDSGAFMQQLATPTCTWALSDGGAPTVADAGVTPSVDAAATGGAGGASAGSGGAGGASAGTGGSLPAPPKKASGCSYGGTSGLSLLSLMGVATIALRRVRRR